MNERLIHGTIFTSFGGIANFNFFHLWYLWAILIFAIGQLCISFFFHSFIHSFTSGHHPFNFILDIVTVNLNEMNDVLIDDWFKLAMLSNTLIFELMKDFMEWVPFIINYLLNCSLNEKLVSWSVIFGKLFNSLTSFIDNLTNGLDKGKWVLKSTGQFVHLFSFSLLPNWLRQKEVCFHIVRPSFHVSELKIHFNLNVNALDILELCLSILFFVLHFFGLLSKQPLPVNMNGCLRSHTILGDLIT